MNRDDLGIYCKKFNRDLVRSESKDPYSYLPQLEKYKYHSKINFVLIFLDPFKMDPDAELLDCRIMGVGGA